MVNQKIRALRWKELTRKIKSGNTKISLFLYPEEAEALEKCGFAAKAHGKQWRKNQHHYKISCDDAEKGTIAYEFYRCARKNKISTYRMKNERNTRKNIKAIRQYKQELLSQELWEEEKLAEDFVLSIL